MSNENPIRIYTDEEKASLGTLTKAIKSLSFENALQLIEVETERTGIVPDSTLITTLINKKGVTFQRAQSVIEKYEVDVDSKMLTTLMSKKSVTFQMAQAMITKFNVEPDQIMTSVLINKYEVTFEMALVLINKFQIKPDLVMITTLISKQGVTFEMALDLLKEYDVQPDKLLIEILIEKRGVTFDMALDLLTEFNVELDAVIVTTLMNKANVTFQMALDLIIDAKKRYPIACDVPMITVLYKKAVQHRQTTSPEQLTYVDSLITGEEEKFDSMFFIMRALAHLNINQANDPGKIVTELLQKVNFEDSLYGQRNKEIVTRIAYLFLPSNHPLRSIISHTLVNSNQEHIIQDAHDRGVKPKDGILRLIYGIESKLPKD